MTTCGAGGVPTCGHPPAHSALNRSRGLGSARLCGGDGRVATFGKSGAAGCPFHQRPARTAKAGGVLGGQVEFTARYKPGEMAHAVE